MAKASEAHIEAYYYFRMSKSKTCWKTEEEVDWDLPQIKSKNDKLNVVKENIQMRVKGYGWKDFAHPWSKNGKLYTAEELSVHLKSIIRYEETTTIPIKPPFAAPARKVLPQLGDQSADGARSLDDKFVSNVEGLEIQARETIRDRESVGEGDIIYSECQPPVMPEALDLLEE